jgi:hypothetical protein
MKPNDRKKKKMAKKTEFRQPPGPMNGSPFQVANFVEKLKNKPQEWAVYCTVNLARNAHSKAQQYKKRYEGTEWVVRREEDGYTVFGRWVG